MIVLRQTIPHTLFATLLGPGTYHAKPLALMSSIHLKKVSGLLGKDENYQKISKISLFRCCYFTQTPMRVKMEGK